MHATAEVDEAQATVELGEALYTRRLGPEVERDGAAHGKIIVIDVATGDYEVGEMGPVAARRLRVRRPAARLYARRIGCDVMYSLGGTVGTRKR